MTVSREYQDWRIFEILAMRMSRIFQSVNLWVGDGDGVMDNGRGDQDASTRPTWRGGGFCLVSVRS